eukprot:1152884-Pelagomonas_calceolata.AAC.2
MAAAIYYGIQVIVGGLCHPNNDITNYVQPNGAGITNTTVRAVLAAIAAAILQGHSHIAINSLSSLHQIRKQTLYLELYRQHVQGHILQIIVHGASSAGPGGNPFHSTIWLAREETDSRPSQSCPSSPRLRLLSDLKNALKSHMHTKHKLGYADRKTGYYTYSQSLLPH